MSAPAEPPFERLAAPRLEEALDDSPVVLLLGPRQCGKTTLAQDVAARRGAAYLTFDDDVTLAAATADPVGFVGDLPRRVVLDEVQRAPGIFTALEAAVDRRREPGRFLLTGSTNVLLLPSLADSLAGRLSIVRLHPLARCEVERAEPSFLDALFADRFDRTPGERLGRRMANLIADGGYPPALRRDTARRRAAWYRDYVETIVQRDIRSLARIQSLDAVPRLLTLAAAQTACTVNVEQLAAPLTITRPTARDYLTLLERVFLVDELPAWDRNRSGRVVKTAKLHMGDTGVACALLGLDADTLRGDRPALGSLLETFVVQELRRQASGHPDDHRFHHYRDRDGLEVDVVIERAGGRVAGVEVKAAATVTPADFRGLRKLASLAGPRFACGVVLYDGEQSVRFGERMRAVPVRGLWRGGSLT